MRRIAIGNMKGGVGKSTLAANISAGLALMKQKVLLLDLDGQENSGLYLGIQKDQYNKTFYDLIDRRNPATLEECIIPARDNLDILPNLLLDQVEADLHREPRIDLLFNEKLAPLGEMGYDFVIVDSPPLRTRVNAAVFLWVDHIILPVQLEVSSVQGVGMIYEYLSELRINPNIIKLVVPTMMNKRTNDSKMHLNFLKEFFKDENILTNPIPRRTKVNEAATRGLSIFEYDEKVATHFLRIIERMIEVV